MNRKHRMSEAIAIKPGNVKPFPGWEALDNEKDDPATRPPEEVLGFWRQRAVDLEILTMAAQSPQPPNYEIRLNPAKLTFYLAVLSLLAAGQWWQWQQADNAGYKRRDAEAVIEKQAIELQHLKTETQKAQQDAADAKKLQSYQAGVADTHETKKEGKK